MEDKLEPPSENSSLVTSGTSVVNKQHTAAAGITKVMAGKRAHGQQQQLLDRVGNLLGIKETLNRTADNQTGKVELNNIVNAAHKNLITETTQVLDWRCPFDRDTILRIWRTPKHELKSEDEKTAFKLLLKYNGTYSAYMEASRARTMRKKNETKAGSHVKWSMPEDVIESDVDARARAMLRALDQAIVNKNPYMDSTVLHGLKQRFPTSVLRLQLEDELDNILREQIIERERAMLKRVEVSDSDDDSDDGNSQDEEGNEEEEEVMDELGDDDEIAMKIKKRAARREKRRRKLKQEDEEAQVLKYRKLISTQNKSGEALEMANLQNQLGIKGCLACRTSPCSWKSSIDEPALLARKKVLDAEIDRVRSDPEATTFESFVALGAQQGGTTKYRRGDLMDELMYERKEIQRRLDLNNVDKELHDCFQTRKEYVEVYHLHGYATILWTNNARRALAARQRRLVAMNVAQEVVDDILEWMLEGWYFGERESSYTAVGYVPSIKKDGLIKPGQDQLQTLGLVTSKMKKRMDLKKSGIITPESVQGSNFEKALPIEVEAQFKLREEKVAKEGSSHAHMLNETEGTIRIGLFMITIMYFRAMAFLGREKRSWGEDDYAGLKAGSTKNMTDERRRMIAEQQKIDLRQKKLDQVLQRAKVGEARKREREMAEKREAVLKLQAVVRRQKLEKESTVAVQRVFRGHLGRKAARRWALKRAELEAMNALLNAAAISIQRVYRGYCGRVDAKETRIEMAHFIALMRAEEAMEDEKTYWKTHPLAKFNRTAKDVVSNALNIRRRTTPLGGPRIPEEHLEDADEPERIDDDRF